MMDGDSFNEEWLQDNNLGDSIESNIPHNDYPYSSSSHEGVATRQHIGRVFVIIK